MTVSPIHNAPVPTGYPMFEGQPVSAQRIRIKSINGVDVDNPPLIRIDDRVRLVIEVTATGVSHETDPKTGELIRILTARAITMDTLPWDPTDPDDDGVVRAIR